METGFIVPCRVFSSLADVEEPPVGNANENEDIDSRDDVGCNVYLSMVDCVKTSMQLSILCGILLGLFTALLWLLKLNVAGFCLGKMEDAPSDVHRFQLIVDAFQAVVIMLWPLLNISPICSWSFVKDSNTILWSIVAGFTDIIDRLSFYIFEHYKANWKSYVGHLIFLTIAFIICYKFTTYRQQQFDNSDNTVIAAFKLVIQFVLTFIVVLPFMYVLPKYFQESSPLEQLVMSCMLIAVFYVPKLIVSGVITNLRGIYNPNEAIVFASGLLISSTMVTRLAQAKIESLTYFTIVSLVHGIFAVIDKLTLPLRIKLCNLFYKRGADDMDESLSVTKEYIAHQSLISVITETTSVILSNAAAYILMYYYDEEEHTGKRYDGLILFKEMVIRSSIAVCIDLVFSIVALKVQNDWLKIPVLRVWRSEWKFILVIHLIQIIYVVVYFADYVDAMLLGNVIRNSTEGCVGIFERR